MKQQDKTLLARKKILATAGALFTQKGFDATTMQDIVTASGLSKGAIYHHFKSKEEILLDLGDEMFFGNNPFEAVKGRTDLNGMQKIREVLVLDKLDTERNEISKQSLPLLNDPRILATAIEENRRILTPLWFELIEEGRQDGSIKTEYAKELSELLPLINFWFLPSIYPGTAEELQHKFKFITEMLNKMGLPLMDDEMMTITEKNIIDVFASKP